jgi:hypothetical protein
MKSRKPNCKINDCEGMNDRNGYCFEHIPKCIIDGCDGWFHAKGVCISHYGKSRKKLDNQRQREHYKIDLEFREYTTKRCQVYYHKRSTTPEGKLYYRNKSKKQSQRVKKYVIDYYSNGENRCACIGCNESHHEFLTIHHVKNNGAIHRREIGSGGRLFYQWLYMNKPSKDEFIVLCINCNFALGKFGYCPHNKNEIHPMFSMSPA